MTLLLAVVSLLQADVFIGCCMVVLVGVWVGAGVSWRGGSAERWTDEVQVGSFAAWDGAQLTSTVEWRQNISTAGGQGTASGGLVSQATHSMLFSLFSRAVNCSE